MAATGAKRCTQSELARMLGVSQVTICKSLNESPAISKEMREKVKQLANQHGYRPNSSARAMRERQFGAIALVQSDQPARSMLIPELLKGIQATLHERESHLLLVELQDEQLTSSGYIPKILREWTCDGLLINYNAGIPERMVSLISEYQIPAIWINSKQQSHCIYPDDFAAGREATEHLLQLGHRRIAYVDYDFGDDCPYPVHYSTLDRFGGYRQAMETAGLSARKIRTPEKFESIFAFTTQWLRRGDRPTAIVAYNGHAAVPIIAAAMAAGDIRIGADLSVISFDTRPDKSLGLPITTMILPEQEMGAGAVRMLWQCIKDRNAQAPARPMPCRFAEGATTARPATR